jgi:hypothetical protein
MYCPEMPTVGVVRRKSGMESGGYEEVTPEGNHNVLFAKYLKGVEVKQKEQAEEDDV